MCFGADCVCRDGMTRKIVVCFRFGGTLDEIFQGCIAKGYILPEVYRFILWGLVLVYGTASLEVEGVASMRLNYFPGFPSSLVGGVLGGEERDVLFCAHFSMSSKTQVLVPPTTKIASRSVWSSSYSAVLFRDIP